MTTSSTFLRDLHRGQVFESGIGHALARIYTGHYQSHDFIPGVGQPSGDGRLTIGKGQYDCEFKAEVNRHANFFFETHGAGGRESALTDAAKKDTVWVHYNGRTDVLMLAWSAKLLPFLHATCGRSGIWQCYGAGDGGHATGYVASVSLVTAQPWVRSIPNFSGTYLTGSHTLSFN